VSLVARNLQRAGLISCRRGHIKLMDVEALKDASCECYEKVRVDYDLLGRTVSDLPFASRLTWPESVNISPRATAAQQ
jgi:hypothetical protein